MTMNRFVVREQKKEPGGLGPTTKEPDIDSRASTSTGTAAGNSSEESEVRKKSENSKSISTNTKTTNSAKKEILNENDAIKPRSFKSWQENSMWLALNDDQKAICSKCTEAWDNKLTTATLDSRALRSREAFVLSGFNCWKNAVKRFKDHENSKFHRGNIAALANSKKKKTIIGHISEAKLREMASARKALETIFVTIDAMAQQGSAFRGSTNDEDSNLRIVLKMMAKKIPELDSRLNRTGYKWLHHEYVNEMLDIMAHRVMQKNLDEIRKAKYFAIIVDETADISRIEQVSINFRIVTPDFEIKEIFMGFHQTNDTKAATLVKLLQDVLLRFNLEISCLRGQCYDGAANMSGEISGVQKKIKDLESRAVYVHCTAHTLNLVVQDAMTKVAPATDFVGNAKELINFIRDSPKRVAIFKDLQAQSSETENLPNLAPFCPTRICHLNCHPRNLYIECYRWCMRIKSLKTVYANFDTIKEFLEEVTSERPDESTYKARGFLSLLEQFAFYFMLLTTIQVLERIEILNAQLQQSDLNINESHAKVNLVLDCMKEMRESGFDKLWEKARDEIGEHGIEEPTLPRRRKAPKRLQESDSYVFKTPAEYYRRIFNEMLDQVITSLNSRFTTKTMNFLNTVENFVVGNRTDVKTITDFYRDDLNLEKLTLHSDMFRDILKRRNLEMKSLKSVVDYMKENPEVSQLLPEFSKLLRLLLTIPTSSCTAERSFSALRRLKTYLRSTMTQKRLNNIALLRVHREMTENLETNELLNDFISRNSVRRATFAMTD